MILLTFPTQMAMNNDTMKIRTEYVRTPISDRNSDWCAYDDNTYNGPGSVIGWGATREEAISNLMEEMSNE